MGVKIYLALIKNIMPESLELKEIFIYFVINKKSKKIIYIGESQNGRSRVQLRRFDERVCDVKVITSKKIKCLENFYFRRYYETRWIYKFKPEYNKQINTPPNLNTFLMKMFLWNENPQADWIVPFSQNCPFKCKFLNHIQKQNKYIYNDYSRVWNEIDLDKQLFINGKKAFDYILNNKIEKTLGTKTRKTFRKRTEKLHN